MISPQPLGDLLANPNNSLIYNYLRSYRGELLSVLESEYGLKPKPESANEQGIRPDSSHSEEVRASFSSPASSQKVEVKPLRAKEEGRRKFEEENWLGRGLHLDPTPSVLKDGACIPREKMEGTSLLPSSLFPLPSKAEALVNTNDICVAFMSNLDSLSTAHISAISNVRRQILGIYTADCLPILLFEPKKEVIGAIHAGYKGLGQGVVYNTIEQLVVNFGCSPSDVLVGLGPFIHACCYEIREDLLVALEKLDWLPYVKKNSDRLFLDLNEIVQFQLRDCGILSSQIESLGLCNSCRSDLFFSARKRTHHDERGSSIISLISLSEKFFP